MKNFVSALCIIVVASMVDTTGANDPSSMTLTSTQSHWLRHIYSPSRLLHHFCIFVHGYLHRIVNPNKTLNISATGPVFAKLASIANVIRNEIRKKDRAVTSTFGPDLEKKEAAMCKEIFLSWKKLGDYLLDSFSECRKEGMSIAKLYQEKIRQTEPAVRQLQQCWNMIEVSLTACLTCSRIAIRHLNTSFEYMNSVDNLRKLLREIGNHERPRVTEFFASGQNVISEIKACLNDV